VRPFDLQQPVEQPVVFGIRYLRLIAEIIQPIVPLDFGFKPLVFGRDMRV
jgi:hypothetical protein